MFLRALSTAVLLLLGFSGVAAEAAPRADFHRGMVVSCPRWGPIWGSRAMEESLSELTAIGVDSVAIHPYGWIKRDGAVEFRPAAELDFLARAVALANAAGVRLFWKPHLGYWGAFEWRGAIAFGDDESAWGRFFRDYERFIVDQARFAAGAGLELFAVGVELEGTTHREADWRRIIARVREVFPGTVVYAANWNSLERVPFWDAVDWIGVHAYFPLSAEADPEAALLEAGWEAHLAELRSLSRRLGKPVLVAEIGYNLNHRAAREPWRYEIEASEASRELRERLVRVALDRLAGESFIRGMYWWKWMPGETHHRRNFSMRDPEMMRLVRAAWAPGDAAGELAK